MPRLILRSSAVLLIVALSNVAIAGDCYVVGDTSTNRLSKPLGSRQNPYGSLAAVQADTTCTVITALHSGSALDGGIVLRNGQKLEGKKGPGGELPALTNSTAANFGAGVVLARDNQLKHLHIMDTQHSSLLGWVPVTSLDFGGDVTIQNVLVTGANQSGAMHPHPDIAALGAGAPSILLASDTDTDITIKNSEIGEANVGSIEIFQLGGYGNVRISNTTVRDQGQLSEELELSPGIWVSALGDSSMDVAVIDTTVDNIGSKFQSNSDGIILVNSSTGTVTAEIDGYHYSNPDGDGQVGTSSGIEMGLIGAAGGSFDGTLKNSTFHGGTSIAVQILDQGGSGSNFLSAHIHDNEIYDPASSGIELDIGFGEAPYGTTFLTIEDNLVVNAGLNGIEVFSAVSPQNVLNVLVQRNTVINSAFAGLAFSQVAGASAATLNLDAGLGGLGSEGNNRIIDSQIADIVVQTFDCCELPPTPPFAVDAANNWWGSTSGPATVMELGGATVDVDPFLTSDPD